MTLKEENGIRLLLEKEQRLADTLKKCSEQITEPQMRGDMQKYCADVINHISKLENLKRGENSNE